MTRQLQLILILGGLLLAITLAVLLVKPSPTTGADAWSEDAALPEESQIAINEPEEVEYLDQQHIFRDLSRVAIERTWDHDMYMQVREHLLDSPPDLSVQVEQTPEDIGLYHKHQLAFAILAVRYEEDQSLPLAIRTEIEREFLRRLDSNHPKDRLSSATALIDAGMWKHPEIQSRLLELLRNDPVEGNRRALSAIAREAGWDLEVAPY